MHKPVITIDIVSDVVCPWCYIGKRRLEKALAQLSDRFDFQLTYHPFELNPQMPVEGANQQEYLSKKFGSKIQYAQITQNVSGVAAAEGLAFHFEKQAVSPNTRQAHRLIALAHREGVQLPMVERLFRAYFTEGVDLSKDENLVKLAIEVGLDQEKTEAFLKSEVGKSEVAIAQKQMSQLGITGVPFYIFNRTQGVSGAQEPSTFIRVIEGLGVTVEPDAAGEACATDGSNC